MKLYWVTTEDHDEDWFVVAPSPTEASQYYENYEGYDPGDAKAEEILDIPENVPAETGWPSEELLLEVGAKFVSSDCFQRKISDTITNLVNDLPGYATFFSFGTTTVAS
jgi:hypothetical protein